jgi:hypothetical protein
MPVEEILVDATFNRVHLRRDDYDEPGNHESRSRDNLSTDLLTQQRERCEIHEDESKYGKRVHARKWPFRQGDHPQDGADPIERKPAKHSDVQVLRPSNDAIRAQFQKNLPGSRQDGTEQDEQEGAQD